MPSCFSTHLIFIYFYYLSITLGLGLRTMYTGQNRSHNRVERGGQLRHCLNGRLHHISDRIRRDLESYKYQMGGVKMGKKKKKKKN